MNRRLRLLVCLFLVGMPLLVRPTSTVLACSCVESPDPLVAMGAADAVFRGEVRGSRRRLTQYDTVVMFTVKEVWKGAEETELRVTTSRDGASCGSHFEVGKEYVVYAQQNGNELETHLCTRTALSSAATADLAALGAGVVPVVGQNGLLSVAGMVGTAVVGAGMLLGIVWWRRRGDLSAQSPIA